MAYVTDGTIGVDLTRVSSGTTTDGENAEFKLGMCVKGFDDQDAGAEWIYVQAGAAISTTTKQTWLLAVDENFQAVKATKALVNAGYYLAVNPQQIIADNAFFWAQRMGSPKLRVGVSCAADTSLWLSTTAGRLDDLGTSGGSGDLRIANVVTVAAAGDTSTSEGATLVSTLISSYMEPVVAI